MRVHPWADLPALMAGLDECLAAAVPLARERYGVGPGADPYRGLYVGDELVERLVRQPLDRAPLRGDVEVDWSQHQLCLLGTPLDAVESAVVMLALGPDVDQKYERIYGYLHDDVNARRPQVGLALDLFCANLEERLAARDGFSPDAPLRRSRLLVLGGADDQPLLTRPIRLDPQVVRHLLGGSGLDERVSLHCSLIEPDPLQQPVPMSGDEAERFGVLSARCEAGDPVRVVLNGSDSAVLAELATELARRAEVPLLRLPATDDHELVRLVARESRLLGYAVHLVDAVDPDQLGLLAEGGSLSVVTTSRPPWELEGHGFEVVGFGAPEAAVRREWWQRSAPSATDSDLDRLAARYRLSGSQIGAAARAAITADGGRSPGMVELAAAARRQSGHRLEGLARRVAATAGWDDLVLPDEAVSGLRELCDRVSNRYLVLRQWQLDRRTNGRLGVNALFAGPSGTGKSMAAQVVARELGLDLFAIDLSGVVSKYIGETEKNLDAIFVAAESSDAVLLFDEADALFGKRSEVRDSHDRYANLEVSYLLQRMEAHDGLAILATNLRQNLDDAFLRRLGFVIRFPFPDQAQRRRIWETIWPSTVPLAGDIDLDAIAQFKLSGGNIRNVALGAAFLAAAAGERVGASHMLAAVDREYAKLGGTPTPAPPALVAAR